MSVPADSPLLQEKNDLRLLIAQRIQKISASRTTLASSVNGSIPLVENQWVAREIKSFQTVERKAFEDSYQRSGLYLDMILEELRKEGLPEQLAWIPLIESAFRPRALSRARALGMWQFIRSTGYRYGLKQDKYVDERMDPVKATRAAIQYMIELHDMFGDWTTAIAAYNCGEGQVQRVIRAQKVDYFDSFWDIFANLPFETARHVPAVHRDPAHRRRSRPSTASSSLPARPAAPVRNDPGRRRRQAGDAVPEPGPRPGRPRRPQFRAPARFDAELPLRPPRPGRLRGQVPGLHRLAAPVHPSRRRHRPLHRPFGRHPGRHRPALPDLGRRPHPPQRPQKPDPDPSGPGAPRPLARRRRDGPPLPRPPSRERRSPTSSGTGTRSSRSPRTYKTTVDAIKAANGLASDILVVGQKLVIQSGRAQ